MGSCLHDGLWGATQRPFRVRLHALSEYGHPRRGLIETPALRK